MEFFRKGVSRLQQRVGFRIDLLKYNRALDSEAQSQLSSRARRLAEAGTREEAYRIQGDFVSVVVNSAAREYMGAISGASDPAHLASLFLGNIERSRQTSLRRFEETQDDRDRLTAQVFQRTAGEVRRRSIEAGYLKVEK